MATMVAIKFNEQMRDFYNRLKDNGKHSTVAQIAVMRKLIEKSTKINTVA